MTSEFKDHFSDASSDYKQYRPRYPVELYSHLASISPENLAAWDCATGSGQSAVNLVKHFSTVIATDASVRQIVAASPKEGIVYRVASAEQSGIDTSSIDLITVAQALHWFNIAAFTIEADRVLKPSGILAVWTYNLLNVHPDIDQQVNYLYEAILGDYWPKERTMVENGYSEISFPFNELASPIFQMVAEWDLSQLLGYLRTWSAFKRYQKAHQTDPVDVILTELSNAWGDAHSVRTIHWDLSLRIWEKR